jgi:Photosynthesis system II assembly factor YCF48
VGWYGSVLRLDQTTGRISTVFAPGAKYRYTWETPLVRSPHEAKTMYMGTQFVMRTTDNGGSWQEISPDLTARNPSEKAGGVIQTIAPSAAQAGEIWVGTSTALVQLTRDNGETWSNVTPTELPTNSNVTLIEPSATDANTAYLIASVPADLRPYIYRTRDGGKAWQKIVSGLPVNAIARVVREDPQRKELLYGGTETGVYVSFDYGDHWQPLQLNLPTTSVRDLNVHGSDLVAATYGRGLWILDDISPLRQVDDLRATTLLKPANAIRARWDTHPDTPLSIDLAHSDNPPDGTIIYYYLKTAPKNISLEIRDDHRNVVRKSSDKAAPRDPRPKNVPEYWFAPPEALATKPGLNRFVWDLQWPHPDTLAYSFRGRPLDYIEYTMPDHAIPGNTPMNQPPGPLVVPGRYELVLTVDGHTYKQSLIVMLDPRVHVSAGDLEAQLELAKSIDEWMNISFADYNEISAVRNKILHLQKHPESIVTAADLESFKRLEKLLSEILDGTNEAPGFGSVNRDLARYVTMIQGGDIRPPQSAVESATLACEALKNNLIRWQQLSVENVTVLNKLVGRDDASQLVRGTSKELTCPN